MDLSDSPLDVQVAKALGWVDIVKAVEGYRGRNPKYSDSQASDGLWQLQSYSTSWCAAGPLVNQYNICLEFTGEGWIADVNSLTFDFGKHCMEVGSSPTEAIAKLVVKMHKDDKPEGDK